MPLSGNGWMADEDPSAIGVVPFAVGGVDFPGGIKGGDVHAVLHYVATQVHERVEPANASLGCWGYAYRENVNSPGTWSNHASATAIDFNAAAHPNGSPASANWTAAQINEIHAILAEVEGAVRWGGDYQGTPDAMHFEIDVDAATLAQVAGRLPGAIGDPANPNVSAYDGVAKDMESGEVFEFKVTAGFTGRMVFWTVTPSASFTVQGATSDFGSGFWSGEAWGSYASLPVTEGDVIQVRLTAWVAGPHELRWQDLNDGLGQYKQAPPHTRRRDLSFSGEYSAGAGSYALNKATFGIVSGPTATEAAGSLRSAMWTGFSAEPHHTINKNPNVSAPNRVSVSGGFSVYVLKVFNYKTDRNIPEGVSDYPNGIPFQDLWSEPESTLLGTRFFIGDITKMVGANGGAAILNPHTARFQFAFMEPTYHPGPYQTVRSASDILAQVRQRLFQVTATQVSYSEVANLIPSTNTPVAVDIESLIDPSLTNFSNRYAKLGVWSYDMLEAAPEEPPEVQDAWAMSGMLNGISYEMDIQSPGFLDYQYLLSDNLYTPPPPVAAFTWAVQDNGYMVDFDASSSSPQPIVTYSWDFGDPLVEEAEDVVTASPLISYTYGVVPYVYLVTLTVTDSLGQVATVTQEVNLSGGLIAGELRETDRGFLGY